MHSCHNFICLASSLMHACFGIIVIKHMIWCMIIIFVHISMCHGRSTTNEFNFFSMERVGSSVWMEWSHPHSSFIVVFIRAQCCCFSLWWTPSFWSSSPNLGLNIMPYYSLIAWCTVTCRWHLHMCSLPISLTADIRSHLWVPLPPQGALTCTKYRKVWSCGFSCE